MLAPGPRPLRQPRRIARGPQPLPPVAGRQRRCRAGVGHGPPPSGRGAAGAGGDGRRTPRSVALLPEGIQWLRDRGVGRIDLTLNVWARWRPADMERLEESLVRAADLWRAGLPECGINWFDEKAAHLAGHSDRAHRPLRVWRRGGGRGPVGQPLPVRAADRRRPGRPSAAAAGQRPLGRGLLRPAGGGGAAGGLRRVRGQQASATRSAAATTTSAPTTWTGPTPCCACSTGSAAGRRPACCNSWKFP